MKLYHGYQYGKRWERMMVDHKWISIEERSEYPDVSTVTNRSWICSKKDIPAVRVGSQWRFKIEDVDEWTQSGRSNFSA